MLIYLMALDTEEKIKFVKIYDAYKDRMHYTASVILKDKLNAEDMVHDTQSRKPFGFRQWVVHQVENELYNLKAISKRDHIN